MSYTLTNAEESFTVTSPAGVRIIEKLLPWASPDLGRFMQAVGQKLFDPVLEIAEEVGTVGKAGWVAGYGTLLSPVTAPFKWLPWLGQWVGVELPKTAAEAEARALLKAESGRYRGTPGAVESAIYRTTTVGETGFTLRERGILIERRAEDGLEEPWAFGIAIPAAHIPSMAALEEAVNAVKPGGVFPWYQTGSKYTWSEATGKWSADTWKYSETAVKRP